MRTGIKRGIKKKLEQKKKSCPCVSTQPGLLHLLVKLRLEEVSPGSFSEGFAGSARCRRVEEPQVQNAKSGEDETRWWRRGEEEGEGEGAEHQSRDSCL